MYECKNCNAKIVEWEVAEAEMDRTRKQRDQNHQIAIQRWLSIKTRPIMYSQRCRTWSGRLRLWAQCARFEAGRERDVGWGARRAPRRTRTSHCSRAHIQGRTTLQNVESTRLTVNRTRIILCRFWQRKRINKSIHSLDLRTSDGWGRAAQAEYENALDHLAGLKLGTRFDCPGSKSNVFRFLPLTYCIYSYIQ